MQQGSPRRAAVYARFSTDLQRDRSITDQVSLCRGYAEREGLTVVATYEDRARTSATLIGRDGILQAMLDAKEGRFDALIVESLDRISRDQEDLAAVYKRMRFVDVDIVAVHDGVANAMQVGIRGLVGEMFLADLKHKIRRGMAGVVREGRHAGGKAYGYRPVPGAPGEFETVDEEIAIVRRIFDAYLSGMRPQEIAHGLNRDAVPAPRGVRWNTSTIVGSRERGNGILRNPIYGGRIVWNRVRMVRDPDTGRRVSRANPESEWQWQEAPRLAVVSKAVWEAVQNRLQARSNASGLRYLSRKPKRLLSGIIRCGECGGGMSIYDSSGAGPRIRCSRRHEAGTCTNTRTYRLDKIERSVVAFLQTQLREADVLKTYLEVYLEERRGVVDRAVREREQAERAVHEVGEQLTRLIRLYAKAVVDGEGVEKEIRALQDRKAELQVQLDLAKRAAPVVDLHPNAVQVFRQSIDGLAERLKMPDPRLDAEAIEAFRQVVSHVTVLDPVTDRDVEIEVTGWLSALTGDATPNLGGSVVAEDRYTQSPQFLIGRVALGRRA